MVQRPLYPEPSFADTTTNSTFENSNSKVEELEKSSEYKVNKSQDGICHIYVLYPPAGIADGDKLDMTFDLDIGSHAVITTPGAGKWYGQRQSLRKNKVKNQHNTSSTTSNNKQQLVTESIKEIIKESIKDSVKNSDTESDQLQNTLSKSKVSLKAEQNLRVKLADKTILEWLPQESIYFDHSVSNADNCFDLTETASLLTWDIAVFGRQAHNETFANGRYNNRLQIWRDNLLLVSEHTQQDADSRWFQSPLGLNNQHVHGSFWAVPSLDAIASKDAPKSSTDNNSSTFESSDNRSQSIKLTQYLDDTIRALRQLTDTHSLPIESTHNYQAINCRYIGTDVRACFEAFYQIRELLREEWFNIQPHRPRIWDT